MRHADDGTSDRATARSASMTPLDALLSRNSMSLLVEPGPEGGELDLILEAGLRAPDHGRLLPWRFVLIRGEARQTLGDIMAAALAARDPTVTAQLVERRQARLLSTPLIIAIGARIVTGHTVPEIEQLLSVGAAAMNILNAVHALGFGGIWITGPDTYDARVGAALGFDPPDRLVGFLFLGTPGRYRPIPVSGAA